MKLCNTCKWYNSDIKDCQYLPPPFAMPKPFDYPTISAGHCCSKWETKLERFCKNCEFFGSETCDCRRRSPNAMWSGWAQVEPNDWCGEFRGKE